MEYEIEETINPQPWQQELEDVSVLQAPLLGWQPVLQRQALLIPEGDEA